MDHPGNYAERYRVAAGIAVATTLGPSCTTTAAFSPTLSPSYSTQSKSGTTRSAMLVASPVEPQRPRIERADRQMTVLGPWVISQPCVNLQRVQAVDKMGGVVAGADRAAHDDQAIIDQMVHERCMFIPAVLLADSAGVVPRRSMYEGAQKEGHGPTLGQTSDKDSVWDMQADRG